MSRPSRRFEIEIHVSGDTWDDVRHAINDVLGHIQDHGPECTSVSGSPSWGHWVTVVERPEMTHERWRQELETYLEEQRKERGDA